MKQKKGMKKKESDRKLISILVTTYARTVYHKREIHLGVCMLEKDNQFPCDCIEFKEKKDKRISIKK
jgi:hypothetical protein